MQMNAPSSSNLPEVWMRGPIPGIPALLQPVAHALLQAQEEIHGIMENFPVSLLWKNPGGSASVGFHLQHIPGVLDRLFTYAKAESLTNAQLKYLSEEGLENPALSVDRLLANLDAGIDSAVSFLGTISADELTAARSVGRKKLPSTVLGLLFHAAEHTMRHTGQLLVTVRWVQEPAR